MNNWITPSTSPYLATCEASATMPLSSIQLIRFMPLKFQELQIALSMESGTEIIPVVDSWHEA